jgi:superfamily I DNA and/or RNA helicase
MKLRDIPAEFVLDINVVPLFGDKTFPRSGIGKIEPKIQRGEYTFFVDEQVIDFRIQNENQINDFNLYIQRGCASLTEVVIVNPDNSAVLKTVFFYGGIINFESIDIGIDNKILDTAKSHKIEVKNAAELTETLKEQMTICVGGDTYFVGMFGYASLEDFENNETNADVERNRNDRDTLSIEKFSIYGSNLKIPIEKKKITVIEKVTLTNDKEVDLKKEEEIFFADKIIFPKNKKQEAALRLVKSSIKFSDYSKGETSKLQAIAAGAMKLLCKDESSYLKKWDEYGNEEGKLLLENARKIGKIEITRKEKIANGWGFYVSRDLRKLLDDNDTLEITDELPVYIENPEMTFEEYCQAILAENLLKNQPKETEQEMEIFSETANIIKIKSNYIELDYDGNDIPHNVFLVYSILGDKVQIRRKKEARQAIISGKSANPMLGLLIEENGELPNIQRVTKIKPLSPFVKDKIFKHEPTEKQKEAIEIALNTPDIALIQGPPGTGKTTVITAIIERLNEEFDKSKNIHGEILVSGFQHDAVENIVSRLSVNSLPGVKFGGRKKQNDDDYETNTAIDDWCETTANKIREKNPQLKETIEQQKLSELFYAYTINSSLKNAEAILKGIIELPRNRVTDNLVQKAQSILDELNPEIADYDASVLNLIYGLRVNEQSFADDGMERIWNVLDNQKLAQKLSTEDKNFLENLQTPTDKDFAKLKEIRTKLLKLFVPRKPYLRSKKKENIVELCAEVNVHLKNSKSCANKEDEILLNFLAELENNPDAIKETVENHSFVFAATTGQAVGKQILKKKKSFLSNPDAERVKYDTVIIDEAARVSPRDLLIPMALGEKRIILVGDHRQLPHIIDEEIAKKLETAEGSINNEYLTHSMFQYLFERLKKLEQKDGICRTVTLDSQYRMHPLLGNFVSDNFYKIHKLNKQSDESFRSPLSEEYFVHTLPKIENVPAVWLDIPNLRGKEERDDSSGSRYRDVEIKEIVKYLKAWKNSEQGKNLSFGVISFYKAQVEKIKDELKNSGITENSKLKIGTVDSFQGMEFDVVFLSMVRTFERIKLQNTSNLSEDEKQKKMQRRFGFLMSKNRLCVSMSRQKRVLVVVGDKDLVLSEIGREAVPELSAFYELCKEKGVVL